MPNLPPPGQFEKDDIVVIELDTDSKVCRWLKDGQVESVTYNQRHPAAGATT